MWWYFRLGHFISFSDTTSLEREQISLDWWWNLGRHCWLINGYFDRYFKRIPNISLCILLEGASLLWFYWQPLIGKQNKPITNRVCLRPILLKGLLGISWKFACLLTSWTDKLCLEPQFEKNGRGSSVVKKYQIVFLMAADGLMFSYSCCLFIPCNALLV